MKSNMFDRLRRLRQHAQKTKLGFLASLPANYIDELDKETHNNLISKFLNHIKRKLIFALVFVPLSIFDFFSSALLTISYRVAAIFSNNPNLQQQANLYGEQAIRNFVAICFSWVGLLVSPKLVSFYFIEDNLNDHQMLSGGKLYEAEVELAQIETDNPAEQVASIIKNAHGRAITVRGAGMSQGEQFIPTEGQDGSEKPIVIDLNKVKHVQLIDKDKKIVKVGAGATWADIQNYANQHKMAVKVMQASNIFSIGGSIGTNIHGWDHHNGTVANTIRAVTVVNPQGEIHTYRKDIDPEFGQVFGTFGMLGIVTEVELELTDNEVLYERAVEVHPKEYLAAFKQFSTEENIRMHLYRLSLEKGNLLQSGVAVNYIKEDDSPGVVTENLTQEGSRGTMFERIAINLLRRVRYFQTKYWQYEKNRLLTQSDEAARQTTNQIMQPIINAMINGSGSESEWLQEYFIPGDQLATFLENLGKLLDENEVQMINATVRFVKADTISPLPYAPEDRFAVVICFNQILNPEQVAKTDRWVRQAGNLAIKAGGAPYMPYQSFLSQKQYESAYGQDKVESFRQLKSETDPLSVFDTGMYQKYIKPAKTSKPNIFQMLIENESYKLAFRGFLENVLCRAESDKFFSLLEDVSSYCDTYEEVYQKMQQRIAEAMPGTFADLKNVLRSLDTIKTDLVSQASQFIPEGSQIDGMLEIGYPGRFISRFKQTHNLTGDAYTMLEAESLTDYLQCGFPRPYRQAFTLDYNDPVSSMKAYLEQAGENSVEVISCFVGLHHFPEDQVDEFLSLVRKALKPEGHFLLVDHNVESEQDMLMAQLAHSVFNIVTGETLENDVNETRNFQPMSYWQALCEKHDLGTASIVEQQPAESFIRDGDPSKNQMIGFQKSPKPSPVLRILQSSDSSMDLDTTTSPISDSTFAAKQKTSVTLTQVGLLADKRTADKVEVQPEHTKDQTIAI